MTQKIILPCIKGAEQSLAVEATQLGLRETRIGVAVVSGYGDRDIAYNLCLWSRLASRVLWQLGSQYVQDAEQIYQFIYQLPWEEHFEAQTTFAVTFNGLGQGIKNSHFGALKSKDAIVDRLREHYHCRPDVNIENPDLPLQVHLHKGQLTVALDFVGSALHQRGYRRHQGSAPLKENLAALLLHRAGWQQIVTSGTNCSLIDPLCGAATLLIEAQMMANNYAPGLLRRKFAFENWAQHIPRKWKELRAAAQSELRVANHVSYYGSDGDSSVLNAAKINIADAAQQIAINLQCRNLEDFRYETQYGARGLIVANPPYGKRLGSRALVLQNYAQLTHAFKTFAPQWQMALISANDDILTRIPLRSDKKYKTYNGNIAVTIALYQRQQQPEDMAHVAAQQITNLWTQQGEMFANRLRKNLKIATKKAQKLATDAFRIYDKDMPEYAFAIDCYAKYVLIQEYAAPDTIDGAAAAKRRDEALLITQSVLQLQDEQLIFKTRQRQSGKQQYQRQQQSDEYQIISEGAAKFYVNLHDYIDTGIFLDHRPLRRKIYHEAHNKRVLNLFCYTATVSVCAALGGASCSDSVDISATYLQWANRNFALNDIAPTHRTHRADVMRWLEENCESRRGSYDLIFCDPPTFSNSKKSNLLFDVQKDHLQLLNLAMQFLSPTGIIYFSNNYRSFKLDQQLPQRYKMREISAQTIDFDYQRRAKIHRVWTLEHQLS